MSGLEQTYLADRGRLTGLVYRMLGSTADADDILQDAYLRVREAAGRQEIRDLPAYLATTVGRLCLDQLKSARRRREHYPGPWLPEPLPDAASLAPSPEEAHARADDVSFALLLVLERLSPAERAAFLLHDVFEVSYAEIARALARSEAACRQLASRARRLVREAGPAPPAPAAQHRALLDGFARALASGDAAGLARLLSEDVVCLSDGGGVRIAALRPIHGADPVARFFLGLARQARARGLAVTFRPVEVNGSPGLAVCIDGELDQTLALGIADGLISAFYLVRNPVKLAGFAARG